VSFAIEWLRDHPVHHTEFQETSAGVDSDVSALLEKRKFSAVRMEL